MQEIIVCALYRFVRLDDFRTLRGPLLTVLTDNGIQGTLLLAREGINGTVAGSRTAIDALLEWLQRDARLDGIDHKESVTGEMPFRRCRVKLKREIVTLGVPGIDPARDVGRYVEPAEWNALISDPDVLLVDTRNDYEVRVGTFRDALNPQTTTFREFPEFVSTRLDPARHRKVAMFCTGGIRCEKSTAFLKQQGFDEVYHLKGGILRYLEEIDEKDSLWEGECFVFDERITVNHRLEPGQYSQCNACRMPINADDMASETYEPGVSCRHCHAELTPARKAALRERDKQVRLARQRGEAHLGDAAAANARRKRAAKQQQKDRQRALQSRNERPQERQPRHSRSA